MATLTNTKIKDTYDGLLKTNDNGVLGGTSKEITDGLGNGSGIYIGTNEKLGVGTSNPAAFDVTNLVIEGSTLSGMTISESTGSGTGRISFGATAAFDSKASISCDVGSAALYFSTLSLERMRIDSSGNVGIGTAPSGAKFHILGTNTIAKFESSSTGLFNTYKSSNGDFAYVGTGSQTVSGGGASDFGIQTPLGSFIVATGGNTERMRITGGGEVLVGTTTFGGLNGLSIFPEANCTSLQFNSSSTSNIIAYFKYIGTNVGSISYTNTSTSYNTSSDYRLKEDWQPIANALDRVEALKPINFAWKTDGSRVDGFLAHELQEVIPDAVTGEKDATEEYEIPAVLDEEGNVIEEATTGVRDVYQGIDQSKIVPLLVAAIQELKAEIELLKK